MSHVSYIWILQYNLCRIPYPTQSTMRLTGIPVGKCGTCTRTLYCTSGRVDWGTGPQDLRPGLWDVIMLKGIDAYRPIIHHTNRQTRDNSTLPHCDP